MLGGDIKLMRFFLENEQPLVAEVFVCDKASLEECRKCPDGNFTFGHHAMWTYIGCDLFGDEIEIRFDLASLFHNQIRICEVKILGMMSKFLNTDIK